MMQETRFRFGHCEVEVAERRVYLNGRPSAIEPQPFDLLVQLLRQRQRVVTKEELLETLWPSQSVSSSTLARTVMKARKAIGDRGEPAMIRSVPRVGYRFVMSLDRGKATVRRASLPLPDAFLLRFGRCEVNVIGRSLRVAGRPVELEPRPFDLLVYLIHHRHRVVSKQELLEKVWESRYVSTSALARAVMKLRQVLCCTSEARLIGTVQRVGYRFVAKVTSEAAQPAAAAEALTLALLPFDNATGDTALDWVTLGLMAMVAETLACDWRLSMVGMESMLGALAAQGESALVDRAAAVRRNTGAQLVVHARVSRNAAGYRLDYRLLGQPPALAGSVAAARPVELAEKLPRALTSTLFRGEHSAPPMNHVRFLDTLAAEAYARGLQMAAEQRWMPALDLFRIALDREPGHTVVQLELLRALAPTATDDTEVGTLAAILFVHDERNNESSLAAHVHQAVGRFHVNRKAFGLADFHLQRALELADGQESFDWTAQTLLLRSTVSFQQRRFASAYEYLERSRELCEHSGNRILALGALGMDACLAAAEGQLERMVRLSSDVVRQARALRAYRYLCDACGNASVGLAELGRLVEAADYADEGFSAALALGDRSSIDDHAANACWIYRLAGMQQASARLQTTLEAVHTPVHQQEAVWRSRGYHAAGSNDPHKAARCFSAAVELGREAGFSLQEQDILPWYIEALILADRLADAQAEVQHAAQLAAQGNRDLQVHLLLLRALLAYQQGNPDAALQFLEQAVVAQPAPLWRTWACADAAWLLAEAGNVDAANAWLARIDTPLAKLPVVLAAQARVQCATYTGHSPGKTALARALTLPSRLLPARIASTVFRFGRCEAHVGTRELRVDGQPRALEPLAFNLLVYLLRRRDSVVSKDELLDQVWGGRIVSVSALASAVMRVRQAIEDDGLPPLVRTLHRIGYCFAGEVSERVEPSPEAPGQIAGMPACSSDSGRQIPAGRGGHV